MYTCRAQKNNNTIAQQSEKIRWVTKRKQTKKQANKKRQRKEEDDCDGILKQMTKHREQGELGLTKKKMMISLICEVTLHEEHV